MTGETSDSRPRSLHAPRRRYHFHLPGVIYVGVTVFLSIGALNSQNNLLFAALGLAMGGLLVSGLVSGMSLMGISVERSHAPDSAVGQPLIIAYTIRNANRFMPAFGLTIVEASGGDPPATWIRSLRPAPRSHVAHIGPGQVLHAEAISWPEARGRLSLNAIQVSSTFPFGIARKSVTFFQPQSILVRPLVLPLRAPVVDHRRPTSERGLAAGRTAGSGDEFWALREYVAGDLPRHIAWRATARTGQLLVSQRAAPVPVRAWVVLRMEEGSPAPMIERAICLAASLIQRAAADGIAIGLAIPASGILRAPDAHRWHVDRLLNELAGVEALPGQADAFPGAAARSGLCTIVWAGDPDPSWGPAAARHWAAADAERLLASGAAAALRRMDAADRSPTLAFRLRGPLARWSGPLGRVREGADS